MTDYFDIRKDLYERFHDAFHKLHVSEMQDEIDSLRDILRINTEQQSEHIRGLLEVWEKERKILTDEIKQLRHRVDHAESLVDKYRQDE